MDNFSAGKMPTVDFFGHRVSRLIIGGNPFSGNSHVSPAADREMEDYYTTENIKKAVIHGMECGVNTIQVRGDKHIFRILRELRNEGRMPLWIAQTASEMASHPGNVRQIAAYEPIAIYHHGTQTDSLFKAGKYVELQDRLKAIRDSGKPVGFGTHMPAAIEYAEEHGWDVDFYMACVYNISRKDRVSSAITGMSNQEEPFFENDIPIMLETIRKTSKPCLAFKILGATRRCGSDAQIRQAFEQAYRGIKPIDAVIVGVMQRDRDQIQMNADLAKEFG